MGDEIGDSLLLGRIWEYISAGTIENSSEEAAALDAYIQNGNVDAELEEILKRYNSEQEMTTVISGMMMNYKANEGNAVLNARLKVIEDQMSSGETQPDETKPNETKPFDEQMMEIVVKEFQEYWDNGPETDDPFDNMFEEYMETGKTDLAGTGLEDMIPEGFDKDADSYFGYAVSQALENYLSRGLEAGKYYSTLMNKYFTSGGNSGYPYFDDKIDALLEGGAVNTQLSYLISAYRKAGETGHDVMDSLFKKYEDKSINSTGILALDKALKAVYSQQVNASTQQAVQQAAQKASGGGVKDTRLYFSVILNYKEELANVERNLKGLDYEDKIAKLEVGVE